MNKNLLKKLGVMMSALLVLAIVLAGCGKSSGNGGTGTGTVPTPAPITNETQSPQSETAAEDNTNADSDRLDDTDTFNLYLTANEQEFTVVFYDTDTNRRLVSEIPDNNPLSLSPCYDVDETHKYYDLPSKYPTNPEEIESVQAGEILMDSGDRLLLYYQDAKTNGNYTRIGYFEDATGVAEAMGTGDLQIWVSKSPSGN